MLAYKLYIVFEDWWTLCLYVVLDIFLSFVISEVHLLCFCGSLGKVSVEFIWFHVSGAN